MKYCIFNKEYSKEDYERLVPNIVEKMIKDGEWGEYFPIDDSPFPYNESVVQDFFPLTRAEAKQKGWRWLEQTEEKTNVKRVIKAVDVPARIDAVPDDMLQSAIECEVTGRPFKVIKQELEFYRRMSLPLPHRHPDQRHYDRMQLRNPRRLWNRQCAKCSKTIATSYAPERPEIVYCEECYVKEVY